MATKLTGDALADKVRSRTDGQDIRVQGSGSKMAKSLKRLGAVVATVAVLGMSAAPAQAGLFDDIVEGAKDVATQTVNRSINNVERGIEREVQNGVREKTRDTVGKTEREIQENTGGIVRTRDGSRAIQDGVNKAKRIFKLPKLGN